MRVLVDTNIVFDVLCARAEFLEDSSKVFKFCELKKVEGYISALSVPNILYIMRKELDEKKAKEILDKLLLIFKVADLKAEDIKRAMNLGFSDFEDALQSACAKRIKANYIVTRNLKDFSGSSVPAIKPSELFERI